MKITMKKDVTGPSGLFKSGETFTGLTPIRERRANVNGKPAVVITFLTADNVEWDIPEGTFVIPGGQMVKVYQDPITKKQSEGEAEIKSLRIADNPLSHFSVQFKSLGDKTKYQRWVDAEQVKAAG